MGLARTRLEWDKATMIEKTWHGVAAFLPCCWRTRSFLKQVSVPGHLGGLSVTHCGDEQPNNAPLNQNVQRPQANSGPFAAQPLTGALLVRTSAATPMLL